MTWNCFLFVWWCLMPLSTIFQLYRGGQFYWWRKPEYQEVTTDLPQDMHMQWRIYIYYCWCVLREWISKNNPASKAKPKMCDAMRNTFRANVWASRITIRRYHVIWFIQLSPSNLYYCVKYSRKTNQLYILPNISRTSDLTTNFNTVNSIWSF